MGFFDDIETPVDKIPTGFGLPLGTHPVIVQSAKPFKKKNGATSLLIKFRVTDGDLVGQTDDWWINKPEREHSLDKNGQFDKEALARTAKNAKRALMSLGLSNEDMAEFEITDADHCDRFVGIEGTLKIYQTAKQKGSEWNTKEFTLSNGESGVSDLSAEPTAVSDSGGADDLDLTKWNLT